ncbi:hypothetical protein SCUCBS95973_000276 [Sporothrix curviconia]|uniref:Zn(2)-C6 fungal-type domain-containing protein n=1 Tax=Sporothrix curviconia TaxID=1260050 RepID=A0ABP0ANV5_9PEZI
MSATSVMSAARPASGGSHDNSHDNNPAEHQYNGDAGDAGDAGTEKSTIATAAAAAATAGNSTLHQLQQLLPTCQRCRRLRRRCDTQLPHCRPCHRAGVECTMFDHALKQKLPRAYVQSLLTRVKHLESVKASGGRTTAGAGRSVTATATVSATITTAQSETDIAVAAIPSPATTATQPQASSIEAAAAKFLAIHAHNRSPLPSYNTPSFDVVVPSAASAGKSRYWGASSVFALTVEVLQHATGRGYVSEDTVVDGSAFSTAPETAPDTDDMDVDMDELGAHFSGWSAAAEADIRALLKLYLASSNILYGIVDPDQVQADLAIYLVVRQQRQGITATPNSAASPGTALGDQAHPYFRVAMMCAIACATKARYRPARTAESLAHYADAVAYVEEVTAEVSPASLQALMLLIIFCLFFPRKGDVWKLLDYACRLALELGYHTEADRDCPAVPGAVGPITVPGLDMADPFQHFALSVDGNSAESNEQKLRRSTFWGLYAIERIVGQLFGRGSDLPESIITVAYPITVLSAEAGVADMARTNGADGDHTAMQAMSIGHHYRLVYLRSEIFRSMYLPAHQEAGDDPSSNGLGIGASLDWLREQYQTLAAWRQELAVPAAGGPREGVATLTCDVGYDATMCFLFQPLLLQALRATGSTAFDGNIDVAVTVASDPFYSSIRLIRTYEKIIRAPASSALGTYPMTFLSAHYIYLASSTLLAHALLRLDGRTRVLPRMSATAPAAAGQGGGGGEGGEGNGSSNEDLDWGAFVDVSGSCQVLLAWCGERWPGMVGMLGVYQQLFGRTIRELIVRGFVR